MYKLCLAEVGTALSWIPRKCQNTSNKYPSA